MVILFIALFITMLNADSFRTINNRFEPYFWEDITWASNNLISRDILDLLSLKLSKPDYAQSLASSKLDEVFLISDLSLLNDFPDAKEEIINAEQELIVGKSNLEYFKRPICSEWGPNYIINIIHDCGRRGGTLSSSGCRVREENETVTYPYRIEATCVLDYLSSLGKYQRVLTSYMNVLKHSVNAVNDIYLDIDKEFIVLENLGAGYENYYGGARQTYIEIDQIYEVMSFQEVTGFNPNVNSISNQYSTTYQEVLEIREEILSMPIGPNFQFLNTLPVSINSLAGKENSLVLKGLILHNRIKIAQEIIITEFELMKAETEQNKELADSYLITLTNERIDLITAIPAEYLITEIDTPEDINPGDYLEWELQNIFHNLIVYNSQADDYYNRVKSYKTNGDNNLGEGIEKLIIANDMYLITQISSDQLLSEFDDLAFWMETNARQKILECNSKIPTASQTSRAFALAYKLEAEELLNSNPQTIGERYDIYLSAYLNSKECIDICEGKEVYLGFDNVLSEFDKIIKAAEKDGIDVLEYKAWYGFYTTYEYGPDIFPSIKLDIEGFIKDIYSLAYEKYETELTAKRNEIKNKLYKMYLYDSSLRNEKLIFEKWEYCFNQDGNVKYEKALGNIKDILTDYNRILNVLNSKSPEVLKNRFEKEYTLQVLWGKTPVLDESVDLDIIVKFTNPTDLSYDSMLSFEIPFIYEVYNSDIVLKSQDISYISKNGGNLIIELSKVSPRQVYEIKFHLEDKFFRKVSHSETIIESTMEYQRIRRIVTFDADISVSMLFSFEDIPENTISTLTEINGIPKQTYLLDTTSKIELPDILKARHVYHFYYVLENRSASQELSQGSYQEEYEDIIQEVHSLQETVDLLNENNLTNTSTNLLGNLSLINSILEDSQLDFSLGKYADAFDKLKKARNITQSFDLFSSLKTIREGLMNDFNQLSAVWIRSGIDDPEASNLMALIEENLVKLRALTLSKEDIPLLGQTQKLLDSLSVKIGSAGKSTLTEVSTEIKYAKESTSNFENIIYPKYRMYYNGLKTYKVEGNSILSFSYTLTDIDAKLKIMKKSISEIETKLEKEQTLILSDWAYISSFRESIREFNITRSGVEIIVNNVEEKTKEYIEKTSTAIGILENRNLGADANYKLATIKEEYKKANEYLNKEDFVEAFKISSKIYYDTLRILSSSNQLDLEVGESPILLIVSSSILLVLLIGGLFFYKGKKPKQEEEIVFTKLKREE